MENYANMKCSSTDLPTPEFEKIIHSLDCAISRESELISLITGKVSSLIEAQKMAVGSNAKEEVANEDGYVNRVNNRIFLLNKNNERLEIINDILSRVIG